MTKPDDAEHFPNFVQDLQAERDRLTAGVVEATGAFVENEEAVTKVRERIAYLQQVRALIDAFPTPDDLSESEQRNFSELVEAYDEECATIGSLSRILHQCY